MKLITSITAVFLLTLISCSKKEDNGNTPGGSGVYAVYSTGGQWHGRSAYLWKDEVQTDYSNKAPQFAASKTNLYLTGVAVSSTGDVYVAGGEGLKVRHDFPSSLEFVDSVHTVLWKNGIRQNLSTTASDLWFMEGQDVKLALNNNNDVFVLGRDGASGAGDYSVWKNGTRTIEINDSQAQVSDLFVKGNDVYVCGRTYNLSTGIYNTALWKNGTDQALTGTSNANCGCVADNNDIYIGCNDGKLLKNNVVQPNLISATGNAATGIKDLVCVGSDVYVLGNALGGEHIVWKNGTQLYKLTISNPVYTYMYIQSLYVSGSDVYVTAVLENASTSSGGTSAAVIYKNGAVYKTMFDGNGALVDARSVFVK